MVLWCQHCVQGRSDVQQDFDRVFVLPDFCGLQSLIPHRLPRYERLDCILQPCLHHCNDFSMHTSCSVLGQKHTRIQMLQKRALVDIVRNHTDLDRLCITFDANTSDYDPLHGPC